MQTVSEPNRQRTASSIEGDSYRRWGVEDTDTDVGCRINNWFDGRRVVSIDLGIGFWGFVCLSSIVLPFEPLHCGCYHMLSCQFNKSIWLRLGAMSHEETHDRNDEPTASLGGDAAPEHLEGILGSPAMDDLMVPVQVAFASRPPIIPNASSKLGGPSKAAAGAITQLVSRSPRNGAISPAPDARAVFLAQFAKFKDAHHIPDHEPVYSPDNSPAISPKPMTSSPQPLSGGTESDLDAVLEALPPQTAKTMLKELYIAADQFARQSVQEKPDGRGQGAAGHRLSVMFADFWKPDGNRRSSTESWQQRKSIFGSPVAQALAVHHRESVVSERSSLGDSSIRSAQQKMYKRTENVESFEQNDDGLSQINQYLILDELGKGAQGTVYLGFDEGLQEFRAIKEFKRRLATSTEMQALQAEIDVMKKLRHKNIVALHEVIDDPQHKKLYLVMQYVEKGPLVKYTTKDRSQCEPIEPSLLVYFARQIAAGLAYIHKHGICHRDIKPENILRGGDDQVFLADFGVADVAALSTSYDPFGAEQDHELHEGPLSRQKSSFAAMKGTPAFFAPEVFSGTAECDLDLEAVDIWAFGVSLFTLLVGRLPWSSPLTETDGAVVEDSYKTMAQSADLTWYMDRVQKDEPEWPESMDRNWKDLLSAMLCKDPVQRLKLDDVRSRVKSMTMSLLPSSLQPHPPHRQSRSFSITSAQPMFLERRSRNSILRDAPAPVSGSSSSVEKVKSVQITLPQVETDATDNPVPEANSQSSPTLSRKKSAAERLRSEVSNSREKAEGVDDASSTKESGAEAGPPTTTGGPSTDAPSEPHDNVNSAPRRTNTAKWSAKEAV